MERNVHLFSALRKIHKRSVQEVSRIVRQIGKEEIVSIILREQIDGEAFSAIIFSSVYREQKPLTKKWSHALSNIYFDIIKDIGAREINLTEEEINTINSCCDWNDIEDYLNDWNK